MALPQSLHVHPHFNAEEAAHVVTGFVSSLENLPGEVTFLLEEIREKDVRISQYVQRINSRHMSLTKTAKSLASLPPSTATFALPIPPGSLLPTSHLSQKEAQSLAKIQNEWAQVLTLQDEKVKLAERLERVVLRAKERARHQWVKVGGMEIEEVEKWSGTGELGNGEVVLPPYGLGSGIDGRPAKKRKPNIPSLSTNQTKQTINSSISMPPPPPPSRPSLSARSSHSNVPSASHHTHTSSLGQHGPRSRRVSVASDEDADGEPDEGDTDMVDGADAEGETDETLYCICRQKSYGEMIGCDCDKCHYEWFHVKCVNISGPLPDTWYCPDCVARYGFSNDKGNKKSRKK
ncbi:uncharacterized protein IAS62_000229 [Cryptococcus decagattii]|uniref:Chromatin modification-related protein n=1 Tax=Cryptococcus decagattii TaxID=1859122 RepID=A0ABZ2AK96_9TREE